MQPIRQNSTDKISVGPAVDLDGFTVNTAVTLASADSAKVKLGDDSIVDISSGYTMAASTGMNGEYDLTLQSGISDTVGAFTLLISDVSLILPIRNLFYVYDPASFDAQFGTTILTARDLGQLHEATLGTITSQVEFISDVAIVSDDNWLGQIITIQDVSTGETVVRWVVDVIQSTDTIFINTACPFTVVTGDIIRIESRVHPTFALNLYDPPTRAELTTDTNSILLKVKNFFKVTSRKDSAIAVDAATEIAELNEDLGNGAGAFSNVTDSQEAIKDVLPSAPSATRAESTTDKNSILAKLPSGLTVGGRIRSAVEVVNGRLVTGTGGAGVEWGDGGPEV